METNMTLRLAIVLACTLSGLSACVVEPYGRGERGGGYYNGSNDYGGGYHNSGNGEHGDHDGGGGHGDDGQHDRH